MDTKNPKLDNYFYKGQLRASTMLFSNLSWMGEDKDICLKHKKYILCAYSFYNTYNTFPGLRMQF